MPPAKKKRAPRKKAENLFIYVGTDGGRVRQAAHDCFTEKSRGLDEFGAEIIDGTSENSEDARRLVGRTLEALQTLPFFGGDKVVWLKGANFMGDSVTGNSKTTQSALEGLLRVLLPGLPREVTFILSATAIDKRRTFYKQLSALAPIEVFNKPDISRDGWEREVMAYVRSEADKRNLFFRPGALELFTMLTGVETQQVDLELEKLDIYLGNRREVEIEDIRQIVSLSRGGVIFEIGNALGRRELPRVLELINHLLYRGETAVGILLGSIVPHLRRLLLAKDLMQRFRIRANRYQDFNAALAKLPAREVAHLPMKKDGTPNAYPLFLAANQASNFGMEELREGLEACLEANRRLVTTTLDPKVVLAQLVIKLLSGQRKKRRAARA